jgi:UDP-2,3-diacylglucosamine pyrophosphatase LpxH
LSQAVNKSFTKGDALRQHGMTYRSIWISDVHLGSKHSQTAALLDFLRENESDHLYLVGDIIDGWELRRHWYWTDEANTFIQKVLRRNRKRTRVVYVHGNHDEFLQDFAGIPFGGVRLCEQVIHVSADGRRFLVIHGHQCDGLVHFNRLLERVGSRVYDRILDLNLHLNRVRRRLGFGYWSVAAYLKFKAKSAVKYVTEFEDAMVRLALHHQVDGVICGHIHRAEIRPMGSMLYMNTGDWVESCTALVEDFEGNFQLIRWHEATPDGAGRGTGSHDAGAGVPAMVPPTGPQRGGRPRRHEPQPEFAGFL